MTTFLIALAALLLGYFVYSRFVESLFRPTDAPTPAYRVNDGVDFVPLPTWKVFMIQLLNIAGLGPIFGALAGALWGPCVYLWIVLGTIFAGGVHDYLSGMISLREDGASITELIGRHMGGTMLAIMRTVTVALLVVVVAVFTSGPAMLLTKLTGVNAGLWVAVILGYYFLATMLPINTIIARVYPLFGVCLIVMAAGILGGLLLGVGGHELPEMALGNLHPQGEAMPIWPLMFITVACGACSGFHSTQSPLMARCLKHERLARPVFYGAMVGEGVIALVWAAAGMTFFDGIPRLAGQLAHSGPGGVVYDICQGYLGAGIGGLLAMLGVVFCPISTGDTALRGARLILAEWFRVPQQAWTKRLVIALPLLIVSYALSQNSFAVIWRYLAWTNQTLATIVLWLGAVYCADALRSRVGAWLCAVPATFMSAVTATYILQASEGFGLSLRFSCPVGAMLAALCAVAYLRRAKRVQVNALS